MGFLCDTITEFQFRMKTAILPRSASSNYITLVLNRAGYIAVQYYMQLQIIRAASTSFEQKALKCVPPTVSSYHNWAVQTLRPRSKTDKNY